MKSVSKIAYTIIGTTLSVIAIEVTPVVAATFVVTNTNDSGAGSLRDAISEANATLGANVIDFLLGSGSRSISLTTGPINITSSNLTIDGPGANLLSVFSPSASFNVNIGATVEISGLGIFGSTYSNSILNAGTATVSNSTLSANGILNTGTVIVSNSYFNTGYRSVGINNSGNATVSNSTFIGPSGPGILNTGTLKVDDSDFTLAINNSGTVTVSSSTFHNSYGTITNSGVADVSDSTFNLNFAGLYNTGIVTVSNSTFSDNAIYSISNSGTATVGNSTLTGSQYDSILNTGTVTVSNSTLSDNKTGITNKGLLAITNIGNTIIARNSTDVNNSGGIINDLGHNLIGNGDSSPFASKNSVNGDIVGTTANPVDPKLGPLADNDGPTKTKALLPGSPAIDAGSNALIPVGITTDQRGFNRISNGTVDIGAFEVQVRSVPEPTSTLELLAFGALAGTNFVLKRQLKQ